MSTTSDIVFREDGCNSSIAFRDDGLRIAFGGWKGLKPKFPKALEELARERRTQDLSSTTGHEADVLPDGGAVKICDAATGPRPCRSPNPRQPSRRSPGAVSSSPSTVTSS